MGGGIGSILYSDRGATREHFTYNAVGHTVAMTRPNGSVAKSDLYEAFGNIVASTGSTSNNRLANTKERSFTLGLDNHGFRYFDPEIGRYITRDPIGYGDGLNVYLYVHNNPINHIDPLGLGPLGMLFEKISQVADKVSNQTGSTALSLLASTTSALAQTTGSFVDPTHTLSRHAEHQLNLVQQHGVIGGARQSVGEVYTNLQESVGTTDLVKAADFENQHSAGEQFVYAWSGVGKSFLTVLGGAGMFAKPAPMVKPGQPPPVPKAALVEASAEGNAAKGGIPNFIYRTGSQTENALTDAAGVSLRDSISSSANRAQVFDPGAKIWAVDTSKLPSGAVVLDGNPAGHVSVFATPSEIRGAIVPQSLANPLGNFGLKLLEDGTSYRIPKN